MALKSYFFDAILVDGEYDREYSSGDFTRYLDKIVGSGVFPNPSTNLQVKAGENMKVIVQAGQAFIDGHKIILEKDIALDISPADVTLDRKDRIILRINIQNRDSEIIVKSGSNSSQPVPPEIVRDKNYLEYSLSVLKVNHGITKITDDLIEDTRGYSDVCGWVQGLVQEVDTTTLFNQWQSAHQQFYEDTESKFDKFYNDSEQEFDKWFNNIQNNLLPLSPVKVHTSKYTTIEENETFIPIEINEYIQNIDILNVYINGFKLIKDIDYTINKTGTKITLTYGVDEGTRIDFEVFKTTGGMDLEQRVTLLENQVDELKGYIGYTDTDIYGVEVDFKNSKFTRLAGATNLTEGANFDNINAYNRRRCILNDNGEVVAYYGDDGYIEDGTVGQVMVEQPKFYYKVVPLELDPIEDGKGYHLRKARYYISDTQKCGFKLHPAFIQNGVEKDKIYLSAYEGCVYDTSASTYLLNDEQVADFNIDKLSSISNAKPCSGITQQLTRANARKIANNRGRGWNLSTINAVSATQLLFLIEYASFNMQEKIGRGIVDKSASSANNSEKTGLTTSLGNNTGVGTTNAITYRGEENFYGNIWKCIDGINIQELNDKMNIYISDNNFKDDTSELPYKDIEITMPYTSGYISAFGYNNEYDWLFITSEIKGDSALPVGDYHVGNEKKTWTTMVLGGLWNVNDKGGGFCQVYNNETKLYRNYLNFRLLYIPQ